MGKRKKKQDEEANQPAEPAGEADDGSGADFDAAEERARRRMGLPPLRKRLRLPTASGKTSALVLIACFIVAALIVIPLARKMPAWIEAEIVLAAWWVIWCVALTLLLHRGWRISDDHEWTAPRNWFGKNSGTSSDSGCLSSAFDLGSLDLGAAAGEGCGGAIAGVILTFVALIVLFIGAWFVIEVAIPAAAFFAYLLIRSMLARVANDHHGCEDSWLRATLWGATWATIYIIPQTLAVWLIHVIAEKAKVG